MEKKLIRKAKLFYSSLPWVKDLADRLAATKPYFWLVKRRINRQKEKDKKGPFNLVIETSNFCNARCLMCPHSKMKRTKKVMDNKTFRLIIERVKREKLPINKVFFSGMGEPLTDPSLLKRIVSFKEMGFPVRLYTNASLMNKKIAQKLVEIGVDEINISFNGTFPAEYEKVMGLNFQKTVDNINYLLKIKEEKEAEKPFIQISSIVIKENEKNIKRHLKNWQDKVESVTVSLAHQWGGGVKTNSNFLSPISKRVYPCRSLWHTFVIDSQGNFVICCRDYESRYILGNILTHSFKDIRKSPVLEKFRRQHLKYLPKSLPRMCQQCNFPYQDGVEWLMPRSLD